MASDIKASIERFYPLIPNSPDSPIVCVVRVFDSISDMTIAEQTFQWSGSILADQTDDEVLAFVMDQVVVYSQNVVAAADEHTDKYVEFARRYSNLVNSVIDIPDSKDAQSVVDQAVETKKKKNESEWKLETSVRNTVDLTPIEAIPIDEIKGPREIMKGP